MLAIVYFTYQYTSETSLGGSNNLMSLLNEHKTRELNQYFDNCLTTYSEFAGEDIYGLAIEFNTLDEINSRFRDMQNKSPEFALFALTDRSGKILAASGKIGDEEITADKLKGRSLANASDYIKNEKIHFSIVANNLLQGMGDRSPYTIFYGYPARNSSGEVNGLFVAFLDWQRIQEHTLAMTLEAREKGFENAWSAIVRTDNMKSLAQFRSGAAWCSSRIGQ